MPTKAKKAPAAKAAATSKTKKATQPKAKAAVKKASKPAAKVTAKKPAKATAKKPAKATTSKKAAKPAAKKATAKKPANATAPKKATKPVAKKATAKKPTKATTPKKAPTKSKKASGGSSFMHFDPYQSKRGEEYMNEIQRGHFKSILLNWKAELMEEVDRTVTHMKDEAANFPDPADRATQEEEFSLELRTRDRERKLIKKIDSTIDLIDQDDYGFCNACGVEIGIKRLEARPTANLCIDCKTLDEIKEKQERG